ncbi:DUF4238 domain-containing protein [Chryseolinea sp. T2]|uniref:DUF4238 domain-containing protein n=1 Tax=Chryseolinea sp. T2 TaxID=3129255 RepID=UPI0030774320
MSKTKPNRHDHYVPECYLNSFTIPDGKGGIMFWKWRTQYRSIGKSCPSQVCYENYFYDLDQSVMSRYGTTNPSLIEQHAFKDFEDNIQAIVAEFATKPATIPIPVFLLICRGYILQKLRTPTYIKGVKEVDKISGLEMRMKAFESFRKELKKDDPRLDRFRSDPNFDYYFTDDYWDNLRKDVPHIPFDAKTTQQQSIIEALSGISETANHALFRLAQMRVVVINAPEGEYFLASDNPGFSILRHPNEPIFLTHSFRLNDMIAAFYPISSNQALMFQMIQEPPSDERDRHLNYYSASPEDMYVYNQDTLKNSDQYVFCCDREYLRRFIERVAT